MGQRKLVGNELSDLNNDIGETRSVAGAIRFGGRRPARGGATLGSRRKCRNSVDVGIRGIVVVTG